MTATLAVHHRSPPEAKIGLFRRLFRGREDVYPRRFESRKTGRAGYAPACSNEWVPGVCEKPRVKCADCQQRQFLPVTEETVRWHLSGRDATGKPFVMGVYPMLEDETCWFLAVDFDKEDWREDTRAYLETCDAMGVPAALERSRSGNGGHVWLFFAEPVSACVARRLGAFLLTETMKRRPETGFQSYDRFFPNQDTMPRGGFGNLIALPLQASARREGNSVFVDADFRPIRDQWAYLAGIRRISRADLESFVEQAEPPGRLLGVRSVEQDDEFSLEPWTAPPSGKKAEPVTGPFSATLPLVLGDRIYLAKASLSPSLRNRLMRLAAFQNPEFYRAQAMRLSTHDKPRIVNCSEDGAHHLILPRGCLEEAVELLTSLGIQPEIEDRREHGQPLAVNFQGNLRPEQRSAARALLAHDTGVLAATTAFGKTVLAAWLIAQRGRNTLVLVHRRQLLEQWVERLAAFLDIPVKEIGQLGAGKKKLGGRLDVALIQSLVRKGEVDDRIADYGHVIVDECHHISAHSFELAVSRAKAKYVTGLSATVIRKDGHHPVVFMQCGPIRHRVDAREQADRQPFARHVIVRPTGFCLDREAPDDPRAQFVQLCESLANDPRRNTNICADIAAALNEDRSSLVLTERTAHLEILAAQLGELGVETVSLRGGMPKAALSEALAEVAKPGSRKVVLATGKFAGEGFDESRLDTLFLTMPVSWRGTVAQYAGRLHRLHHGKKEVRIYDYADLNVPMLARMFDKRLHGYETLGYTVLSPASAIAGWPDEVPLPTDASWKHAYAESARRLVHDGVDVPLARLFSEITCPDANDEAGTGRARSASEAFLYHRLQSLSETQNRFTLNQKLPIAFGSSREMEVDLLCRSARLAIEIDGRQHLESAEAYRRDRHKDALLQENGYFVLRFLAEDIGTRLEPILGAITRALQRRSEVS